MVAAAAYLDNDGQANLSIDSSQPISLRVEGPSGNITVRGDSRNDVLVTVEGYDGDDDEMPLVSIEARGNDITIKPSSAPSGERLDLGGDLESVLRQAASWISRAALRRHEWPDITVEIPRHLACQLEVHAASGDIDVEEVSGVLTVRSASGDLHLSRIVGQLNVQSASGDISLEDSVVAVTARTASGDLHLNEVVLDGIKAQTASGDCYVEGTLRGNAPTKLTTASGDVHLNLEQPENTGATLSFRTVAGDSQVESPFRKVGQRRWQLGSGEGPQIEVTTVSGDLHVDTSFTSRQISTQETAHFAEMAAPPAPAAPEAPAAPIAPTAPASPDAPNAPNPFAFDDPLAFAPPAPNVDDFLNSTVEEGAPAPQRTPDEAARIAVLEAVARGELDIDEALRRLETNETSNA